MFVSGDLAESVGSRVGSCRVGVGRDDWVGKAEPVPGHVNAQSIIRITRDNI